MDSKRIFKIVAVVAVLLCIPFVAMQFTNEVNWGFGDFIVAGVLLLSAGFGCSLALKKAPAGWARIAWCTAVLAVVFLAWAELAVGIFGTPLAGS